MAHESTYKGYPPSVSKTQQSLLIERLKDYALSRGFAVKPATISPQHANQNQTQEREKEREQEQGIVQQQQQQTRAIIAPITLYPSLFPRSCFNEALAIQQNYNLLYANIANDSGWLSSIVPKLAELDDFVASLWQIHLDLQAGDKTDGYIQPISLGLFRSDYMVHLENNQSVSSSTGAKANANVKSAQIRQVEFNTIASSFGGLSTRAAQIHRHLAASHAYDAHDHAHTTDAQDGVAPRQLQLDALPESDAATALANGLAEGHRAYLSSVTTNRPGCVVFVVQANERNIFDQKHVENELVDTHHIPVFRVVFDHIAQETSIDNSSGTRALLYSDPLSGTTFEVTVVYYRAGYAPSEYTTPAHWSARRELERSRAIKCPTVLTQLAGMKKVQQVLAAPNSTHLTRFLPDTSETDIDALQRTFAPMYPLDDTPAGIEGRRLATNGDTAKRFVLKPQREGGGNNIYRSAIPSFLRTIPQWQWDAYILMEMIEPPAQRNIIVRDGGNVVEEGGVICELGVYGTCLWTTRQPTQAAAQNDKGGSLQVLHNATAGYLLRTKGDQSEEGGVAAGFGALDSPLLVDL